MCNSSGVSPTFPRDIGVTSDIKARLNDHNAGKSPYTAKFKPRQLMNYIAFERYLKSGSGHAFANKRRWGAI